MIGFLAPAALAGLAALAVPLAIHLWSRRPRRPIPLGSLALLRGAPPARARSLRLRDPWLLALRLAIVAALVVSLARPWWAPGGARPGTWALLSDEALTHQALRDSLRAAGAELRLLEPGIPRLEQPGPPLRAAVRPSLWSLLLEADRLAPLGTRLVVVAPLTTDQLRGPRPAIAAPVVLRPVAPQAAACPAAERTPVGCVERAPRRVAVLADAAHTEDARYVTAALRAAAVTTGLEATFQRGDAAAADWIVWLDRTAVPEALLARVRAGAVLLTTGAAAPGAAALARFGTATVERDPACGSDGAPVWTDGSGVPLLTVARLERGRWFRFCGRFHPAAGSFVLTPEFPEAMAALWVETRGLSLRAAPAPVTVAQAMPAHAAARPGGTVPPGATPLATPLWALAALLFATERGLALRRRRGVR